MSSLNKLFFPPQDANEFTLDRYLKAIESGEFRDLFNLGVCEAGGGTWLLKDFVLEPNCFYSGNMGSGKSMAAAFTLATWLMSNSDQTICFVADSVKGAQDYQAAFVYDQVYPLTSDGGRNAQVLIERAIDMIFSEAMARRDLYNEIGANSIKAYEELTGKKMARVVLLIEEFHTISDMLEYEKNYKRSHTTASKLHQIMKIGRSFGIFVIACSQRSTSSDVPPAIVGNFTQKMIFKVTLGEANYVLGRSEPAYLTSAQKGRCWSDWGQIQYPYLPIKTQQILLKKYMKPLSAECAYLNPQLISDYLEGKSTTELYRLKKMSELAEAMESFDGELVLEIIHEKIGNKIEKLDSKIDNYGACMIVTTPSGERKVVMYRDHSKVGVKTLNNLSDAAIYYKCAGAYLYCLGENLPQTIYNAANDLGVKIFDHDDIKLIARQIDANKIASIHRLEAEIANTSENPRSIPHEEIVRAKRSRSTDLSAFQPVVREDTDESYVDPESLDSILLGEDPAIMRARRQSTRRRQAESLAPGNSKKKKKQDGDGPTE